VPETARQDPDTIVVLRLNKSAVDLAPVTLASDTAIKGAKATASNFHQNDPAYAPAMALDGLGSTRWATDGGTHTAWLAVRFNKPKRVGGVQINEACGDRVRSFVLEYKHGKDWKPFYKGSTIGEKFLARFAPVKATEFRLNILEATEGPTLWEFQLLPPKK
jgi:hypothetical protein